MEAKSILENIKVVYPNSNLHLDNEFISCLQEEISAYWECTPNTEAFVTFSINESGDILFAGIHKLVEDSNLLSIKIESPAIIAERVKAIEKELVQKRLKAEENAKIGVNESLDQIVKIELDKKKLDLLNHLLKNKNEAV